MLARHKTWLLVLPRGCIVQTTSWTSMLKVVPSNRIKLNLQNKTKLLQVSNFSYLGAVISGNGTIDKELSSWIQKASNAFYQLSSIWNSYYIRTPTKVRIYKTAILTMLVYG